MKKTVTLLLGVLLLAHAPALAKDKAVVKFGPIKFKSTTSGDTDSVAGTTIADNIQISIGGSSGTQSGVFTIFFPVAELSNFTNGYHLDLVSFGDDGSSDAEAIVSFLGTKVKVNGLSSTTTSIASINDSTGTGKFTAISYNSDTKVLKFKVAGKVGPYSSSTTKLGQTPNSKTVTKPLAVNVVGEVTLEI